MDRRCQCLEEETIHNKDCICCQNNFSELRMRIKEEHEFFETGVIDFNTLPKKAKEQILIDISPAFFIRIRFTKIVYKVHGFTLNRRNAPVYAKLNRLLKKSKTKVSIKENMEKDLTKSVLDSYHKHSQILVLLENGIRIPLRYCIKAKIN